MKKVATTFLFGAISYAADAPIPVVRVDNPRTVTVSERSVVDISVSQFQDTLVALPEGEKVRQVFVGDSSNWVLENGKKDEPTRYISIKVKDPIVPQTTVNIISDHDHSYTFHLTLSKEHCDSKVFIDGDSQLAKENAQAPAFVPAADVARYKQVAEQAQSEKDAAIKAAQADAEKNAEQYRAQYPGKLDFNYDWDRNKGDKLGLERVWSDDKFVYLRGTFQETPALYEVKDKKPSLVNFSFDKGLYTVPKKMDSFYLAIGKQKLDITREGR